MTQQSKVLGGVLLVSGTTLGAGMLALPVSTGMAGFFPAFVLFTLYYVYMTFTAYLILEATLWMKAGENFLSLAGATLGKWGKLACSLIYLFLLYALTTAYIAGGSSILLDTSKAVFDLSLPEWAGMIPLLLLFGFFVYKGAHFVDHANRVLMGGMLIAYAVMIIFLTPYVKHSLLTHVDWKYVWMGVSVAATSFGFHIIIPSLVNYMNRDVKLLKRVILIGSLIPYLVYISWEFLALGIIPIQGPHGIHEGFLSGANGVHLLNAFLSSDTLAMTARFFSFFAIVTSFLGVSLSLSDFLADGFKIKKSRNGRMLLYILTFFPPLLIALHDPRAFLSALEYAGAFGVVVLLGLFPALFVWSGRYGEKQKLLRNQPSFTAPGGKWALIGVIVLSLSVILLEIGIKLYL